MDNISIGEDFSLTKIFGKNLVSTIVPITQVSIYKDVISPCDISL